MADVRCTACGADNRPGGRFCSDCGAALAQTCPSCGALAAGRFCSECGSALGSPTDAATRTPAPGGPTPVAERRVVSLLFGDLVSFTPLSEARDPEAVRELLSAYFDRARAVVERYGGTVEKFIGDAVFAVWGVPVTQEDDAERAVRAGLDLLSAVAALGEELGVEGLQMRVGITTGQVAVTLGALGEGMVAGDAVNTAARVQSVAGPGEVWVDDTTRSLTTAALAYEAAGSHELKGKSLPMQLFRTVRTTAGVGGEQRVDGLEAPFVGRDRELRLVKELFHATAEEGRSRLVLVAGEPGIGKSRLSWEFEKYLDAITSHTTFWLRGRCLSYGQGVAGRVVAEMIRSLLRVTDSDDEATVRAALEERLTRHVAGADEREVLRPRLESLLGLLDRAFDQADLFACWRGFLEALTSDGSSVTLVAEDLQWADDGFLDFLDHLLEVSHSPIMVVALSRPEVLTRRPGIGAGRRATTVFLEPLPDAAMHKLLAGLVVDLPVPLRDELVRRAEGVPLYAVETVRSLIDRDVVVPLDGRYVVDPAAVVALDLADVAPPASLHALLAARLDALTPDERRIVQDGSVLGLSFTRPGLEALTPVGVDLDRALDGLRRKEILTLDTDPRSAERGQLRFVQALLRGVAYDTLARRDRKARHIAAANHLAQLPDADALAGVLAAHYLDAAAAVPEDDDVATLRRSGGELLERAALHAADVGAPVDAVMHYARLLALDIDDEVVVRVSRAAAELVRQIGFRLHDAQGWVDEGMAAAQRLDAQEDRLSLQLSRAHLLLLGNENLPQARVEALAVFEASVGRPERVGLVAASGRLLCICAQAMNDPALAQDITMRALSDVERFGDEAAFSDFLSTMSVWFGLAGYRRLATLVRRASADQFGPRDPAAIPALANLAAALVYDDPEAALAAAAESRRLALVLGSQDIASTGHVVAAALVAGRFGLAREVLAARPREDVSDLLDWEAYLVAGSAALAWATGDTSLLRPAVAIPDGAAHTDPVVAGWWLMREAVAVALTDGCDAAVPVALQAVERMRELGAAHEDLPFCFGLAVDLLLDVGDLAALEQLLSTLESQLALGQRFRLMHGQLLRARAHVDGSPGPGLRAAVEVFEAAGAGYWAALARAELAQVLTQTADPAAPAEAAAAAELLAGLGASRPLARLEAAGALVTGTG